eukprot:CAMPEP_0170483604 /NCGR_PEP_ID=MMETSP0208-20121228/3272_1 /TAXON_ID=197538 /ORGANISM="Strombidium inclinatum, Strain S3" /LENGTH=58 /DNA_ID=CAMNT_0010756723 /DNA_START=1881 /DNA_END=2057 /DNA_ORIENTATION=-
MMEPTSRTKSTLMKMSPHQMIDACDELIRQQLSKINKLRENVLLKESEQWQSQFTRDL